ncbi:MAG TPA: hypothetical protein PKA49_13695, partial [Tepidiformaceae bacterium]|nr:hypothetical protein [Tepidiformaceae bacterium]
MDELEENAVQEPQKAGWKRSAVRFATVALAGVVLLMQAVQVARDPSLANLAVAAAQGAAPRPGARLSARAVAGIATLRNLDLDLRFLAMEGIVEPDLHVIAQVCAAPRLLPPAAECPP